MRKLVFFFRFSPERIPSPESCRTVNSNWKLPLGSRVEAGSGTRLDREGKARGRAVLKNGTLYSAADVYQAAGIAPSN
jgi:hypothetical protein